MPPFKCLKTLFNNRYLVGMWVWKDLHGRYVGSAGGWLWAVVLPAAMMATYFFVFSFFLRVQVPYAPGATGYFIFLMSGLLPWNATFEALQRSTTIFIEQGSLVQKVAFPLEVLPSYITVAALFQPLVGMALFAIVVAFIKGLSLTAVIFLPLVVVIQFLFILGLAFALSAVSVFFRDITQGISVILQIWFFASPILYPMSMMPEPLKSISRVNPVALVSLLYQSLFLKGQVLLYEMIVLIILALGMWCAGSYIFSRLKGVISDLV